MATTAWRLRIQVLVARSGQIKPFFRRIKLCCEALVSFTEKSSAPLTATIGHVKDFYFNDQQWAIRYVVAVTASWLSGRLVLIFSPRFPETCLKRPTASP